MENLVAFEYGSGRIWGYVTGASADEVVAAVPELDVYDSHPTWMTDADIDEIRATATWELNGSASRLLDRIIASRIVAESVLVD